MENSKIPGPEYISGVIKLGLQELIMLKDLKAGKLKPVEYARISSEQTKIINELNQELKQLNR